MIKPRELVGTHDVLMIVLDALRYDVAKAAMDAGLTPNFASIIPGGHWQLRHTPGNFTFPAHQAFFAGFLPTPIESGTHHRLFALSFDGSLTTGSETLVFDSPDIISGFSALGYHTVCIGGVGFFNKKNALGNVLPAYFDESYWSPELGVTELESTRNQVDLGLRVLSRMPQEKRLFMFLNVSALHQPNCIYTPGVSTDSKETQMAALAYVDNQVPRLINGMRDRAPLMVLIFSDHGTAYGENGYVGHRVCHEVVWNVPYAEFVLERA